jgi:hypothetical protein
MTDTLSTPENYRIKPVGLQQFWNPAVALTNLVSLGTGSTPVAKTDVKTETEVYTATANNWGGFSPSIQNLTVVGPVGPAAIIQNGSFYMSGYDTNIGPPDPHFIAWLRYNYTPLSVGIGESIAVETTISV